MENEVTLDAKTLHWEREAIEKLLMADLRERRAARRWQVVARATGNTSPTARRWRPHAASARPC